MVLGRYAIQIHLLAYLCSIASSMPQLQSRLCITDSVSVQTIGRRLSLRPQTLNCDQAAVHSPGLQFNGLHPVIHVITITWIIGHVSTIDHLLTLEGRKAELSWLVDP